LWEFLADENQINAMIASVEAGLPAIKPLLEVVESLMAPVFSNSRFAGSEIDVFINNQVKQIMELCGYENCACGMLREARFVKMSGMYKKTASSSLYKSQSL
jgi:hypothetical protein